MSCKQTWSRRNALRMMHVWSATNSRGAWRGARGTWGGRPKVLGCCDASMEHAGGGRQGLGFRLGFRLPPGVVGFLRGERKVGVDGDGHSLMLHSLIGNELRLSCMPVTHASLMHAAQACPSHACPSHTCPSCMSLMHAPPPHACPSHAFPSHTCPSCMHPRACLSHASPHHHHYSSIPPATRPGGACCHAHCVKRLLSARMSEVGALKVQLGETSAQLDQAQRRMHDLVSGTCVHVRDASGDLVGVHNAKYGSRHTTW
eukprot:364727-Chlamydomonas_euryale.AAC.1